MWEWAYTELCCVIQPSTHVVAKSVSMSLVACLLVVRVRRASDAPAVGICTLLAGGAARSFAFFTAAAPPYKSHTDLPARRTYIVTF